MTNPNLMLSVPNTWKFTDGEGVSIAVIDTGCDINHQAFDNIDIHALGIDNDENLFSKNLEQDWKKDKHGHGTFVCSIIAKMVPKAKIISIKAVGNDGATSYSKMANAIYLATTLGCTVINISVGGDIGLSPVKNAVKYAEQRNISIICAAGNSGHDGLENLIMYPAKYKETIAVGSVGKNEELSLFSTIGKEIDFVAIGEDVRGAGINGEFVIMSGTSFSCPYVSSIVAMCNSKHLEQEFLTGKNDCETVTEVREHLIKYYARDIDKEGKDINTGNGIINISSLIKKEQSPLGKLLNLIKSFFGGLF